MAETRLQFIDANPATEAFQRGQLAANQQLMQQETIAKAQRENFEGEQTQGSRLRKIGAESEHAVADAAVASGTVQPRIASSQAGARTAISGANVAEATEPARIETAQAGAQSATAGARTATSNANVSEQTEGTRVEQAGANLRSTEAATKRTEAQGLHDALDRLDKGDIDGAAAIMKQHGEELPQAMIDNADMRAALKTVTAEAIRIYPNRPKDQMAYLHGWLSHLKERMEQGQRASDPTAPLNVPGAPEPPVYSAPNTQHPPADVATAEWLVSKGIAKNPNEAWEIVRHSRSNPQAMQAQIFSRALQATGGDAEAANKITNDFIKSLTPAPTPTPAPATTVVPGATAAPTVQTPTAPARPAPPPATAAPPPQITPQQPTPAPIPSAQPPVPGARQALDGNWYVDDPDRPGKYLQVTP
jgi:hypothetical protein